MQDAFVKELEQGLGLQAGAVQVVRTQMQKARYAEDVLRLGRHLMAEVSATAASTCCYATAGSGVFALSSIDRLHGRLRVH